MSLPSVFGASQKIPSNKLTIAKARELAEILESKSLDYVTLVGCYKNESIGKEIVYFTIEVERSQKIVYDIKKHEQIAVFFDKEDKNFPEVYAFRKDFPKVPHTNLMPFSWPKSLCLFDQPYTEVKRGWTATRLIKRIHHWLSETSRGKLHGEDQPLEPLFLDTFHKIIIPNRLVDNSEETESIRVSFVEKNGVCTFIAEKNQPGPRDNYIVTIIKLPPQEHGLISKTPTTLKELHDFCVGKINLVATLRDRLKKWNIERKIEGLLGKKLLLITVFPKTRYKDSPVETTDIYGFLCDSTIQDIGEAIDVWQMMAGNLAVKGNPKKEGEDVKIHLCRTIFALNKSMAASLNNIEQNDQKILMVGLGSLGSQIFMNLIRAGFGKWDLIDDDVLLPHNLARHALQWYNVGSYKINALALEANLILDEKVVEAEITDNLINPIREKDGIEKALISASVILDCSASIAVSRYIGIKTGIPNRTVSCFLNPSGDSLILLAEDKKREITLDILEMQYYRFLLTKPELKDHLKHQGARLRYSNSCRDISMSIRQDFIAIAAGISSASIKDIVKVEDSVVSIWHINSSDLSVAKYSFMPIKPMRFKIGEWTLITDEVFITKVQNLRTERLPNETGGVLIGNFDLDNKIVFVADMIPSPPDSKEWPTTYIRGYEGLKMEVDRIKDITWDNLDYIGEWHSHPQGHGCQPSTDDREAFKWLNELMWMEGLPGIMLIVGDGKWAFYLNRM